MPKVGRAAFRAEHALGADPLPLTEWTGPHRDGPFPGRTAFMDRTQLTAALAEIFMDVTGENRSSLRDEQILKDDLQLDRGHPRRGGKPLVRLVTHQQLAEYVLVEGFRYGDAGKEHVTAEHFKKFLAAAPALLASTPLIISQTIDATGWSEMGEMKVG